MADKPTQNVNWAFNLEIQDVLNDQGQLVQVPNKIIPDAAWQNNGVLWQTNLPYPFLNYKLDEVTAWINFFADQRQVGDPLLTAVAETETTVNNRFGGTWQDNGTDTFAGQTFRLFIKLT